MEFDLTKEQEMIRKEVRKFAQSEIAPVAQELDEKEEFSVDLTRKMGEIGLFGMFVSEKYEGQGLDYLSYIIAVEEVARIDGSQAATVAAGNSLGIGPLYYFGSEEQKQKYLPKLCRGEALWGFGLTEPTAGSDAGGSKTTAVKDGNEWVLNGSKIFITNAACEMSLGVTVQAITGTRPNGKPEYTCFIVEHGTKGFKAVPMHKKMMWRSSNTAELYFDDVRIPEKNILGKPGDGFHQMLKTLDGGRLSIGAMGLGGAQGAYELALKYAKQREQFGQPISKFQAVAFKLADSAMEIECARNLLYKACWLRSRNRPFEIYAAMGKLYCSELMGRVADRAVQIHGGYGLMKDYNVERFYRDQKLLDIGEGTSEVQRIVISRHIGC
ncbi:acyl-CoA dehydrogenase family protein [Desulfococcus multivorans]|uniref:Cyclohexane-1-carbonyl-CoA dehydrogenase n=1 Tax=Desulfococcus multivorans DSM 2059 TaxID=1121405 RepID=S7TKZ8_DESML|nr:acyl-CoA dehydrogenase family protein [Desulfococcus multivorans]AOY59620.1 AcdA10: acyl-CoA dehydrogenase [Desulfococcus multivorans]AQV01809.1 acyl-CoA dehydrogenase [Desulfococcus multivorans]EPR37892.1 acyl-CoA dehydrogenase domain-containing protein [Desulfococcus multivorans DSM 2059]MDX9819170.1 acyl-CoA dehydrogenase family protein [Desulfococcus multivorans]SKA16073.1 Acyl-CoA dehydrogenase [Desulfococcus multivorans DSM 2059]